MGESTKRRISPMEAGVKFGVLSETKISNMLPETELTATKPSYRGDRGDRVRITEITSTPSASSNCPTQNKQHHLAEQTQQIHQMAHTFWIDLCNPNIAL